MDRFVSHYLLRLDSKGRISIPAPFRAVLAQDGFEGLFFCPALDRPAIDVGGKALLSEIEQLVASFPPYSEEHEQFSTALYGTSEMLKMDAEGRVTLTEALKDHAGIMEAASFVGLGHKFQIWAPDRLGKQLSEATGAVRKLRKRLSVQGMAAEPRGARER